MGVDYARPTSDVSIGQWLTQTDAPGPLWQQIDESVLATSDYAYVSLAGPQGIPNQIGNATTYTTQNGTACTMRAVYAGGTADDYHYALLFMPNSLDRTTDVVIVNYFHGSTANELQVVQNTVGDGANGMLDSWLDLGWAVMSYRLGTTGVIDANTDNDDGKWGNGPMRAAMADAYAWLHGVFDVHPAGFLFFGFSAGGVNSVNALMEAYARGYDVAALAMVDPALNLRSMFGSDTNSSSIHNRLQVAYSLPNSTKVRSKAVTGAGTNFLSDSTAPNWTTNSLIGADVRILYGTGGGQRRTVVSHTSTTVIVDTPWTVVPDTTSWYCLADTNWIAAVDTADNGHDPMFVDIARIPDIPMMLNASPTDLTVHKERNADSFVFRLAAAGWTSEVNYTSIGGTHGANSHWRPVETNAFYARALAG